MGRIHECFAGAPPCLRFFTKAVAISSGEGGGSAAVSRNEIDLGAFINRRLSIADLAALKAYNEKRRRSRFLNVTLARFMEDYLLEGEKEWT